MQLDQHQAQLQHATQSHAATTKQLQTSIAALQASEARVDSLQQDVARLSSELSHTEAELEALKADMAAQSRDDGGVAQAGVRTERMEARGANASPAVGGARQDGTEGENVATPANWTPGGDVVIPVAVSDEDARAKYGEFTTHFPYLRTTKLPG